jgi:four helix bundle protein
MTASHYHELRAWRLAYAFKLSVYDLVLRSPLAADFTLRDQLRNAAASAPSNISEGFARFDPADFARLVKIAKASLVECQNHLQDAVDRGYISGAVRDEHLARANEALKEIGGLIAYLQSPEAKRNAERIRRARIEQREQRRQARRRTNEDC